MTKTATILASIALASSSIAGTSMVSAGKGKAVTTEPTTSVECPCLLSYKFVEAGYIRTDVDNVGEANGGYVDAYYQVANNVFVDGSYTHNTGDLESDSLTVGAGGYVAVAKCVHLVGRAGYSYFDADGGSEDAWYISPGIRAQVGCNLELYAKVYIEFGDDDEFISYGGGAVYHINSNIGINVGYATNEDTDAWSLQAGLRYAF
jgi:hypothetical protein